MRRPGEPSERDCNAAGDGPAAVEPPGTAANGPVWEFTTDPSVAPGRLLPALARLLLQLAVQPSDPDVPVVGQPRRAAR